MSSLFLLLVLFQNQSGDLLDAVNSERGGRHWIDQKPDPPKSPAEQAASFRLEPGCKLELVAAEPLVLDPVWIDFDARGRMFVAEYSDYPIGPVNEDGTENKDAPPLSRIVMLEDKDGDGKMDKRTVFADKLQFCHSFMPLMGGVLAGAQTEILFLKDTDGDGVADVREVWFDGFTPAHPQMQIGCPRWGMDNWIYLTYAPGEVRCRRPGFETKEPVKLARQDMRFHPVTMKFETVSGMGQFGNTCNNDGYRFFSTNRNPIMMEVIPQDVAGRNPFASISKRHSDVGPSGGDTKVFPLVTMKSNWLSHAGTHTSACGVTAYRGDLWDESFQQSVFACEPVGLLVTRTIVTPQEDSPVLAAKRAEAKADFLASSDTWFRPASMRTGMDGALYLADMYRMWVEHPKFLPPEIAAQIDWRAGEDKGRIWRIVPEENSSPSQKYVAPESADDLVAMLSDTNGQRRITAQRRLVENADAGVADKIAALLSSKDSTPFARMHALWTLHGLSQLNDEQLVAGLNDESFHVRRQAAEIARRMPDRSNSVTAALLKRGNDVAVVQHQVALASGQQSTAESVSALTAIAKARATSKWFQQIVLTSSRDCSGAVIAGLLTEPDSFSAKDRAAVGAFLSDLASVVGARGDADEIAATLKAATDGNVQELWAPTAILTGLAKGLPRHRGSMKQKSLASLLSDPLPEMEDVSGSVQKLLLEAADCTVDEDRSTEDRVAAVALLSSQAPKTLTASLEKILSPGQPASLQQAAIQAAGLSAVDLVLDRWNQLPPAVRSQGLTLMLARPATTQKLLDLMSAGTIAPSVVDIDQRVRLLQHRDEKIKKLAGEIFGGVVSANRKAVADEYQPALTLTASKERGAAVFEKTCSKCHKIDGKGNNVGPDISDTRNRSRDALLYDILDPNRRVDPQFNEYIAVTVDGRTYNGLLVSDTGQQIVLRQPEGKEQTLARADIEELQATSRSLMPEGMEKDVTVQQMADLLEFLKAR
ncbi:PVC-type heme-binding CxxCH protein [Fuerstiella marisgermanici]|uniref:Putative membrane-bound dehydrogenase domain protein n=1 Tax=Fuerstiella marisgermanici TaxID=1891926 RepID=A0A1P8WI35_9PLAN|nr:PVC-type heme-binding CxxCH protein [Fuerstiella marisgermanici]APZ93724.1 putative membrane-bound dehydrogenase domain protein [Fuerstiella marisgermanici]